jgi:hypothetical protein
MNNFILTFRKEKNRFLLLGIPTILFLIGIFTVEFFIRNYYLVLLTLIFAGIIIINAAILTIVDIQYHKNIDKFL